jgi:hypothetical protein
MEKHKVVLSEIEYNNSKFCTNEWCLSVVILNWEHDFVLKQYTIIFILKM